MTLIFLSVSPLLFVIDYTWTVTILWHIIHHFYCTLPIWNFMHISLNCPWKIIICCILSAFNNFKIEWSWYTLYAVTLTYIHAFLWLMCTKFKVLFKRHTCFWSLLQYVDNGYNSNHRLRKRMIVNNYGCTALTLCLQTHTMICKRKVLKILLHGIFFQFIDL